LDARVTHLFIKTAHGGRMEACAEVSAVADKGLAGDVAFGTTRRQVLVVDSETLEGFDLAPGAVRENITVSGIALRGLPRGARLQIDEVVLEITGDCTPCDFLDALRPGLKEAIVGRRGLLARVAQGGKLKIGDPVRLHLAEPVGAPTSTA
jgi:MOSC domain-containing protein YiiM